MNKKQSTGKVNKSLLQERRSFPVWKAAKKQNREPTEKTDATLGVAEIGKVEEAGTLCQVTMIIVNRKDN